jgi:hypothetical protein
MPTSRRAPDYRHVEAAISLVCDLVPGEVIGTTAAGEQLRRSKLEREEARLILAAVLAGLDLEPRVFWRGVGRLWPPRRDAKGRAFGWFRGG